jgi:hypothetical protein
MLIRRTVNIRSQSRAFLNAGPSLLFLIVLQRRPTRLCAVRAMHRVIAPDVTRFAVCASALVEEATKRTDPIAI